MIIISLLFADRIIQYSNYPQTILKLLGSVGVSKSFTVILGLLLGMYLLGVSLLMWFRQVLWSLRKLAVRYVLYSALYGLGKADGLSLAASVLIV